MAVATRTYPYVMRGLEYAQQVVSGERSVCQWVRLACQRHLDDLARYTGGETPYYFDAKQADRVCDIVQHFPHIRGIWAKHQKRIELEPWQCFIVSVVFGWLCTATHTRRFRICYIEVPRKNAKSTLTSAIGLYLLACDGEAGAHVVSAANTREQAKLLFTDAQLMARKEPGFRSKFGVEVLAHVIAVPGSASKFEALSAEHSNLDGLNLHAALIDELHAHPTRGLWDVLETATGSRTQPLIWAITTAGVNRASVCYDQRAHVLDILSGRVQDDSYFGIVYTLDDGDDPFVEETWIKSNPNYGVSVHPEGMRTEGKRAQQMPSAQPAFLTKHNNVWINAALNWLPVGAWDRCGDPLLDIEDFAHEPCYIGIDLALRSDIAALVIAFPPNGARDSWAVFGRYYLPEDTVNRSENSHYQAWETIGRLTSTPGAITDFDYIIAALGDLCALYDVKEIALDPFDAGPLIVDIEKAGLPRPVEVRQTAPNLSPSMVELEGLVLSHRIKHDADPLLAWMMSNVKVARSGDLFKPIKESDEKKIDGVIGLLMCINRAMRRDMPAMGRVHVISMGDD
jgi:phage terminase large subunit-like protein